jgi:hypothetical protein
VTVAKRMKTFLEMDADEQRAFLTQELADWIDAGFWSLPRSDRFHRRVKILARRVGMDRIALLDELRADAESCDTTRKGGGR